MRSKTCKPVFGQLPRILSKLKAPRIDISNNAVQERKLLIRAECGFGHSQPDGIKFRIICMQQAMWKFQY